MAGIAAVPESVSLIDKADLLKTLKTIQNFDTQGVSPYVAVQLMDDNKPLFYRSSHFGYVQSEGFGMGALTYVSLGHFLECLKVLPEDRVEVGLDGNGTLHIVSADDVYQSELRVHTVRKEQAGLKRHDIGDRFYDVDSEAFKGIDVKPFKCSYPPILAQGKLMLPTIHGIVMWRGPDSLKPIELYPRESFLRLVAGKTPSEIVLMRNGYWGAVGDGLVTFISGHNMTSSKSLYEAYNVEGKEITRFPAGRLIAVLTQASGLIEAADNVIIDPKAGVAISDKFGTTSQFSLGPVDNFARFKMSGATAATVVDALSQDKTEEQVVLYNVPAETSGQTLRLSRGPFEVSFKTT